MLEQNVIDNIKSFKDYLYVQITNEITKPAEPCEIPDTALDLLSIYDNLNQVLKKQEYLNNIEAVDINELRKAVFNPQEFVEKFAQSNNIP